ncbi:hypothetical protein DL98DRAFT_588141 [Cadophora sp. DSE1049]|nr:hypothetical protein DL98DRAFT_588141 [Cadophora sp. DSE1049]
MPVDEESGPSTSTQSQFSASECLPQAPSEGLRAIVEDPLGLDRLWTIIASGLEVFLASVETVLAIVQKEHSSWYIAFAVSYIAWAIVSIILLTKLYTLNNPIYRRILLIAFFCVVYATTFRYIGFEQGDIIRFAPVPCTLLALIALLVPGRILASAIRFIGEVRRGEP